MRQDRPIPALRPHQLIATAIELDGIEFVIFELPSQTMSRPGFTRSENAIIGLIAKGYTTAQIAAARDVSYRTVANQLAAIYQKASLNSRTELLSALQADFATATWMSHKK